MLIRTPMRRLFRPHKPPFRLARNLSRHFASDFHDRERVEEERISDYDPARYCPIELGSNLEEPDTKELYTTLVKLGFGGTSTTWLCKQRKSDAYKVLKVGAEFMTRREKKMLEKIKLADPELESLGSNLVRQPERIFDVARGEQTYNCFVFEPLGPSLLEFSNRPANKPLGIQRVRVTIALLLHALEFLHKNGIAHTDIKPDNIQLTLPDEVNPFLDEFCAKERASPSPSKLGRDESRIVASREMIDEGFGYAVLCDFGSAFPDDQTWDGEAQSLPYRAPEVILGAEWDHKVDIWNIGVLIWQLMFDQFLFGAADQHLSIKWMVVCLGPPPKSFLERCRKTEAFFDEDGNWKHEPISTFSLEDRIQDPASRPEFLDFMRCCLQWDPRDRSSAAQMLEHSWLQFT